MYFTITYAIHTFYTHRIKFSIIVRIPLFEESYSSGSIVGVFLASLTGLLIIQRVQYDRLLVDRALYTLTAQE